MRRSTLTFRDATGSFYEDRWKPLFEGVLNIILSILLVNIIGVTGVIVATIVTNVIICHLVEPYVLYKNAFSQSPRTFYLKNYALIILFGISLVILDTCLQSFSNCLSNMLVNGFISVVVSVVSCAISFLFSKKESVNLWRILRKKTKIQ